MRESRTNKIGIFSPVRQSEKRKPGLPNWGIPKGLFPNFLKWEFAAKKNFNKPRNLNGLKWKYAAETVKGKENKNNHTKHTRHQKTHDDEVKKK